MKRIAVLGAPLDFGAGRRGVDMGPSAIRLAGLAERLRSLGLDQEAAHAMVGEEAVKAADDEVSGDGSWPAS